MMKSQQEQVFMHSGPPTPGSASIAGRARFFLFFWHDGTVGDYTNFNKKETDDK